MPLSYDGTGRTVDLQSAWGDPGTSLPNRVDRAVANNASAWMLDCNPSEDSYKGLVDMPYDYEMRGKDNCMIPNGNMRAGDGSTDMVRNLGL